MIVRQSDTPLFSYTGALIALVGGCLLYWPLLLDQVIYVFGDTGPYLRGGERIWEMLAAALPEIGGSGPEAPLSLSRTEAGNSPKGRSFVYSAFLYILVGLGHPLVGAVVQGALALLAAFAMISRAALKSRVTLATGAVVLIFLSSLPYYAVFFVPDIFAAVLVLYAACLLHRFDSFSTPQKLSLIALATFSTATHYGNMPLMAGLAVGVLGWRLVQGRLGAWVLVATLVPVAFFPLSNLAASAAVLEKSSAAPLRLPILLARSIEDGPAFWYLQEACPEADLAFCEAFGDDIPDTIRALLWENDGIGSLPAETTQRIREEEFEILFRAFQAYPVQQTASLLGNAVMQVGKVGVTEIAPSTGFGEDFDVWVNLVDQDETVLAIADRVLPWMTLAAALGLFGLVFAGRLDRRQVEILAGVVAGMLLNAAIFGGLSAPVDRYQARIAWILPFLLTLFVAEILARHRRGARCRGREPASPPQPTVSPRAGAAPAVAAGRDAGEAVLVAKPIDHLLR